MSIFELVWLFFLPVTAVVIAVIQIRVKNYHGTQALDTFLMWQIGVGLGLGCVYEMLAHGDYSPNNTGPFMYIDLFYPVLLIALLYLLQIKRNTDPA